MRKIFNNLLHTTVLQIVVTCHVHTFSFVQGIFTGRPIFFY